jgi:hypothetical protein
MYQWEMLRLMEPVKRPGGLQRLTIMMALLALGSPQVYGCQTHHAERDKQTHSP